MDRVAVVFAPRLFGGDGTPALGPAGFRLADAPRIEDLEIERLGEDVLVTGRL